MSVSLNGGIGGIGGLNQGNSIFSNPQLLSALLPNYNIPALVNAMQAEVAVDAIPLTQMTQQVGQLQSELAAWQALQTDVGNLQTDVKSLAGTSLYQTIAAKSGDSTTVAASATTGATGTAGSYQVSVTQLARPEIDRSNGYADATTALGYTGSFTVDGVSVQVASTDSLSTLAQDINAADAGVTATVLSATNNGTTDSYLSVASGDGTSITWTDPNAILQDVGLPVNGANSANLVQSALPAQYTVNGISESTPSNTDSTTIPGVTLDLLQTTGSSPVTVSVTPDQSAVVSAFQQLASDYNAFLSDVSKYAGKGGVLEGDATVLGLADTVQQQMTGMLTSQAQGYQSLSQIGVTLSAPVGTPDNLTMSVAAGTLQAALASNPTAVAALMNAAGGIATVLQQTLGTYVGATGTINTTVAALQTQISDLNTQINDPNSSVNLRIQQQQQLLQSEFEQLVTALLASQSQGQQIQGFLQAQYGQTLGSSGSGGGTGG